MIAKHVPMRSLGKSSFAGLVEYITNAQNKDHRLGQVRITNCDALSVQDAITEVVATQNANTRAKSDKTCHLIISFQVGEQPSTDTLQAIEKRICEGLGYADHQRISAVHNDTDNLHIHIAINKIHPNRHTVHEPYHPYRMLAELCTILEQDYDLERDNHAPKQHSVQSKAADMERHSGIESLISWMKRECLDEMRKANSWQALHQVMRDNGLQLRERANGLVIKASDGTIVKASSLARDFSKQKLEKRLGSFEASSEQQKEKIEAKRQYKKAPIPLRVNTAELYAQYKEEQRNLMANRTQTIKQARQHKDHMIEAAKRTGRLRRSIIKLIGQSGINKKLLYTQAYKAMCNRIQKINLQYRRERQVLYATHSRRTWVDWLQKEAMHGNTKALNVLRARRVVQTSKGNSIESQGRSGIGTIPLIDNITKKGTIIFKARASTIRDDGQRLQVSHEASNECLQAALRLTMEKYGQRITVNGTITFKAQIIRAAVDLQLPITFADPELEKRRLTLLTKEKINERNDLLSRTTEYREGARRTGRSFGNHGQASGINSLTAISRTSNHRGIRYRKPDIGGIGNVPPPQSQNRLRTLSELSVVRLASGTEVLLPRHVSHHMEQQGTQSNYSLRRGISRKIGEVLFSPGCAAADKYIAERELKRLEGFDIPRHTRYTAGEGTIRFHGIDSIENQTLALLKRNDEVIVMPIDQAAVRRLSGIAVGDAVSITSTGAISISKGRAR